MNKLYALITIVAIFIAGYFAGKRSADNRWHNQNELQLQSYNQQLTEKIKVNNKLSESYNTLNTQYLIVLKDKQYVLEKNRQLIDANNRITKQLVRYIQGDTATSGLQNSNTESAISTSSTISATDFGIWASGLITHDLQCVSQLNSLIEAINNVD